MILRLEVLGHVLLQLRLVGGNDPALVTARELLASVGIGVQGLARPGRSALTVELCQNIFVKRGGDAAEHAWRLMALSTLPLGFVVVARDVEDEGRVPLIVRAEGFCRAKRCKVHGRQVEQKTDLPAGGGKYGRI